MAQQQLQTILYDYINKFFTLKPEGFKTETKVEPKQSLSWMLLNQSSLILI